jgi:hypothetical protein
MFMIGRLQGFASVIKFSKSNFNIQWKVNIKSEGTTGTNAPSVMALDATTKTGQETHMTEILSAV